MLNLDFLKPKQMEPWYDLHLSDHANLNPSQREAHFHSMLHSQWHDYNADLRLVLTEKDQCTGDPWKVDSYRGNPSFDTAERICKEVVIRRDGREFVVKAADGRSDVFRDIPQTNTGKPAGHVKGGRDWDF